MSKDNYNSMADFNLTEREKGWLEGIIDGEGCISIGKSKSKSSKQGFFWNPICVVSNTNLKICEKVKELFSDTNADYIGGCITKRQPKLGNSKIIYTFSAKRYSMKYILPQIKFIAKERQREIVIKAMDILEKYKISNIYGNGQGRPDDIENEMIKLYEEMKMLNKRGTRDATNTKSD